MPLGAIVTLVPQPGRAAELRQRALDVADVVRDEPGNVLSLVLSDPQNPEHTLMLELFRDQAAIDAHKLAPATVDHGPLVAPLLAEPIRRLRVETVDWAKAAAGVRC